MNQMFSYFLWKNDLLVESPMKIQTRKNFLSLKTYILLHILLMTCKTHSAVLTNTLGVQFITKKLLEYKNNIQTEGWSYFDP